MDGTLINGRLLFAIADKVGASDRVREILGRNIHGYEKSAEVAKLWKGLTPADITDAIRSLQMTSGAKKVIDQLRKEGHKVGIISDSYTLATSYIARELKMDFHFSNTLLQEDGILTGELQMPLGWEKIDCDCKISVCKRYHLERAAYMFHVDMKDTVAIGDTQSDMCMIRRAGVGIAFNPKDDIIGSHARVVKKLDMCEILQYIK
jgi:phosphoserine phosphatase